MRRSSTPPPSNCWKLCSVRVRGALGVTFENLQDTYEIAIAENNIALLNQLNTLFRSLYVDTQKYMFDKHGVKATDRVNYERDTKRMADQYTQRYLEDQQAAPEGAK